jgi:hypothetical protein
MTARKGRTGPIMTLALGEAPAIVRETLRAQLTSHRFEVARAAGAVLAGDELERFLRDVANNVTQALYGLELGDD